MDIYSTLFQTMKEHLVDRFNTILADIQRAEASDKIYSDDGALYDALQTAQELSDANLTQLDGWRYECAEDQDERDRYKLGRLQKASKRLKKRSHKVLPEFIKQR